MTEAESAMRGAEYARVPETCRNFGVSKNWLYNEAAAGRVRMVKIRSRTLVELASVRAVLAKLPAPKLRSPKA